MARLVSHSYRRMGVEGSDASLHAALGQNLLRLNRVPRSLLRCMHNVSITKILSEASMLKSLMATLIVIGALFTASMAVAQAGNSQTKQKREKPATFIIQDNEFRYWYSSWFSDPYITNPETGKAQKIAKNVIEFVHVDLGNKLGDNTFDVQYLMDNTTNPTSVTYFHNNEHAGSKDVYFTYRHDLVIDRIVNRDLSKGPIKNWIITMGADFGSKNDDFSSQRRSPMIGPGVNFKIPNGGYWKVVAVWTREWNEEGTDITSYETEPPFKPNNWGKPVVYGPQEVSGQTAWGVPFSLGKALMTFEGFGVVNSSKGYGAGNLVYNTDTINEPQNYNPNEPADSYYMFYQGTRPEVLLHGMLVYNAGALFGPGHNWQIGVGYEYWHNIFGVPQFSTPTNGFPTSILCNSCIAHTPFVTVNIHL